MRDLLPKPKLRQIELVDFLYHQDNWVTIKDIARHFNCSERTIKKDLSLIRNDNNDIFTESSSKGIQLRVAKDHGIETYYRQLFEKNYIYHLLEIILNEGDNKAEYISEKLFISIPTLYRLTNQYNDILEHKYGIRILTNPFSIEAEESHTRFILSQYYTESYSSCEWPFEKINENIIESLIKCLCAHFNIALSFPLLRALKLTTTVNLLRTIHGHSVILDIDFTKADHYYHSLCMNFQFKKIQTLFLEEFHMELNEILLFQLFTPYLKKGHYIEIEEWEADKNFNITSATSYNFLSESLNKLSHDFNIPLINKEQLMLKLHNAITLEGLETRSIFLMSNRKQHFCKLIQKNYPLFFNALQKEINAYRIEMGLVKNSQMINHLLYLVFVNWNDLIHYLHESLPKLNALILSDFDHEHAIFTKNIIDFYFSNILNTIVYRSLTLENIEYEKYDIIISNFHIPESKHPFSICLDCVPTKSDIAWLRSTIELKLTSK